MDQINHSGRHCDSELRFCGTAQRFWTQRLSARLAGRLADARNCSSHFPWAHQADGDGKDGGSKPAVNPKPPYIRRKVMREVRMFEMWRGTEWMMCMEGVREVWDELHTAGAELAWPEAGSMRRGAGWWFGDAVGMEVPDSAAVCTELCGSDIVLLGANSSPQLRDLPESASLVHSLGPGCSTVFRCD
ncbi:hypothetical protein Q5P01_014608 [Channa striata]|uniref:Uncharacterized protein n=1 Tax=Channa striata TaxID=64152 RepID=A0AA88SGX2_CHASR|nr:hypothetical protein Q5P01_014608 [Channa striata]